MPRFRPVSLLIPPFLSKIKKFRGYTACVTRERAKVNGKIINVSEVIVAIRQQLIRPEKDQSNARGGA
jgi:hypothetical protein